MVLRRLAAGFLLCSLLFGGLAPQATAATPASCPGDGAPAVAFTGEFDTGMEGAYVYVPFQVPPGITRVELRLCHDQPEAPTSSLLRHTLDLGLYQARLPGSPFGLAQFRGWGGSSRLTASVAPNEAGTTVGFNPGPIPPGEWGAEIGVAAVVPQTLGDADGKVGWRLEVFLFTDPADLVDPWSPAPYDTTPARTGPGWFKGDFHVHARHSNPNDATMQEVFDCAFGARPQGAGLDFITLSDYVTDRHWGEIGRFQASYPGKLIVRSAEVITYRGHAINHASVELVDYRTGPIYEMGGFTLSGGVFTGGNLVKVREARGAAPIFDAIHAAGGWTHVAHPTIFDSRVPGFGNICRGCSWDYTDDETDWIKVDVFEVHTGPGGTPQPPGNELGPNPFTVVAIEWWDRLRAQGYPITGVAASDSHNACTTPQPIVQSPIGEGTTVVYAPELSEKGIHQAMLAGHAYMKLFASDGPDLRFEARPSGAAGPVAIMGDALDAPGADFEARVMGAAPNPQPRLLVVMRDGQPIASVPVTSNDFTHTFSATQAGDYRLQLMRGTAIEALTNPITLGRARLSKPGAPPPLRAGGLSDTGRGYGLGIAGVLALALAIVMIRALRPPA